MNFDYSRNNSHHTLFRVYRRLYIPVSRVAGVEWSWPGYSCGGRLLSPVGGCGRSGRAEEKVWAVSALINSDLPPTLRCGASATFCFPDSFGRQ